MVDWCGGPWVMVGLGLSFDRGSSVWWVCLVGLVGLLGVSGGGTMMLWLLVVLLMMGGGCVVNGGSMGGGVVDGGLVGGDWKFLGR